jgi:hypothetical protein
MCFVWISEQIAIVSLYVIKRLFYKLNGVYWAVLVESLYKI